MDALLEFLDMGGYAFYVWTSYAIAALMLAVNLIVPLRRERRLHQRLRRALRAPAGDAAADPPPRP